MYEKSFNLEIITPKKVVFKDEAASLSAPGVKGGFQILHSHAPFLATVEIGEIKMKDREGRDTVFATSGGFVEVKNNSVVVLVETAEQAREIDVQRAEQAKDRALQRLQSKIGEFNIERARLAMMRAMNRLRIAAKA
jgi:F-type H+-transporting ATPase subunit epsilon